MRILQFTAHDVCMAPLNENSASEFKGRALEEIRKISEIYKLYLYSYVTNLSQYKRAKITTDLEYESAHREAEVKSVIYNHPDLSENDEEKCTRIVNGLNIVIYAAHLEMGHIMAEAAVYVPIHIDNNDDLEALKTAILAEVKTQLTRAHGLIGDPFRVDDTNLKKAIALITDHSHITAFNEAMQHIFAYIRGNISEVINSLSKSNVGKITYFGA